MPSTKSHIPNPRPEKLRRSRDYNAKALSIAKKAIGQFSGDLANPIVVNPVGPGLASAELSKRDTIRRLREKFFLLFGHFGIDPRDSAGWMKLSWHLSINLVPGLITIVGDPPVPRKSRSDKFWTLARYKTLVSGVAIRLTNGDGTRVKIESAVFQLVDEEPRVWGAFKRKKNTLVTRYYEAKQLIEEEAIRESLKGLPLAAKEWLDFASGLELTGRRSRMKKPVTQRRRQRQRRKSTRSLNTKE
jgi:hypothetical protein